MNRKRHFFVFVVVVCFSLVESTLLLLHLERFLAALGLLSSSGAVGRTCGHHLRAGSGSDAA